MSCTPGQYCSGNGNFVPSGFCLPGFYCNSSATTPTQFQAAPGYFSGAGASTQSPCAIGTFNLLFGQVNCTTCLAGYYCPNQTMTTYTICPAGNYCPSGSSVAIPCPVGTYSSQQGNKGLSDCASCSAGSYCSTSGLIAPTALCNAGYYCSSGAISPFQVIASSMGGPCTAGSYCPAGSGAPVPCPSGTLMNSTLNTGDKTYQGINYFCDLCPSSFVCANTGLTMPSGGCGGGYFCSLGAKVTSPVCTANDTCAGMYGICPVGSFCPPKTGSPVLCADGSYSDATGAITCKSCPAGKTKQIVYTIFCLI